jgi:hypothetical protein
MTTNDDISQAISALIDRLNAAEDKLNVNPIAFNWTPAMSAIWPDGMRPTMSGLLAVWEAMHEAAVYDGGWIDWDGGEQPVPNGVMVECKFNNGDPVEEAVSHAWRWYHMGGSARDIVAYRVLP